MSAFDRQLRLWWNGHQRYLRLPVPQREERPVGRPGDRIEPPTHEIGFPEDGIFRHEFSVMRHAYVLYGRFETHRRQVEMMRSVDAEFKFERELIEARIEMVSEIAKYRAKQLTEQLEADNITRIQILQQEAEKVRGTLEFWQRKKFEERGLQWRPATTTNPQEILEALRWCQQVLERGRTNTDGSRSAMTEEEERQDIEREERMGAREHDAKQEGAIDMDRPLDEFLAELKELGVE